jgi:pheromone shutdown protein TraB
MTEPLPAVETETVEQPLRRVMRDGVEYVLLGTAHVSRASADAVRRVIA